MWALTFSGVKKQRQRQSVLSRGLAVDRGKIPSRHGLVLLLFLIFFIF